MLKGILIVEDRVFDRIIYNAMYRTTSRGNGCNKGEGDREKYEGIRKIGKKKCGDMDFHSCVLFCLMCLKNDFRKCLKRKTLAKKNSQCNFV